MAKVEEFLFETVFPSLFAIAFLCALFFALFSVCFYILCHTGMFGCSPFTHFYMDGYFCEFCGEQIRDLPVICPNCDSRLVHDFCSSCGWSVSGC